MNNKKIYPLVIRDPLILIPKSLRLSGIIRFGKIRFLVENAYVTVFGVHLLVFVWHFLVIGFFFSATAVDFRKSYIYPNLFLIQMLMSACNLTRFQRSSFKLLLCNTFFLIDHRIEFLHPA